jgi:Uncharacterized protein conserved in bacteria
MSAAYGTEPRDSRAFRATHRGNDARRFRAAKRHSRRVRLLRIGLPTAAIVACALLAFISWFNPLRMLVAKLPISVGDVIVSGTKIKMENPKLSGFTRDKRRYDITAGAASQDLTQPGMIELHDINAVFEMQDKTTMKLVARDGVLETKNDRLTLEHDIVVISSNGEEGYFEQAVVDTKNGNVVSEKPVRMKLPNGTVKGNRFELTNSGEIVRFEKGVVAHMKLDNPPKPAKTSAATP